MTGRHIFHRDGTESFFLDGKKVTRAQWREAFPDRSTGASAGAGLLGFKALHLESLAYHPKQRVEATAHLAKLGVPTYIDPQGRPVVTSKSHYKALRKALGVHHNNSAYDS